MCLFGILSNTKNSFESNGTHIDRILNQIQAMCMNTFIIKLLQCNAFANNRRFHSIIMKSDI